MRQLFSKAGLRQLSFIVAITLLLAGGPSAAGFVIVSGSSQPEFTINICQPIQMFDLVSNTLLARPAAVLPEFVRRDLGSAMVRESVRLVDCRVAPDTPPPKSV
jgi:hypothetical protein